MTTERGEILGAAREATEGARNKSYGDPGDQLGLAGMLKEVVRDQMVRDVSPGEMEALDMVLTKLSRAVMGGRPGRDTYVDMAAYAAIAGELAERDEADRRRVAGLDYDLRGVDAKTRALIEEMDRQRDAEEIKREYDAAARFGLGAVQAGRREDGGHTAGCYLRGFPSTFCTCHADEVRAGPDLDESAKAEIRRHGPGPVADSVNDVTTGVGPLTGLSHSIYDGDKVARDVADQKRREAERNAAVDRYTDRFGLSEYGQRIAKSEGDL